MPRIIFVWILTFVFSGCVTQTSVWLEKSNKDSFAVGYKLGNTENRSKEFSEQLNLIASRECPFGYNQVDKVDDVLMSKETLRSYSLPSYETTNHNGTIDTTISNNRNFNTYSGSSSYSGTSTVIRGKGSEHHAHRQKST